MVRGIGFGLLAALVGAAAWAALIVIASFEISLLAIAIGALVGFAVAFGAKEKASMVTGVIAALLALVSVVGGKVVALEWGISEGMAEGRAGMLVELEAPEALETLIATQKGEADEEAGVEYIWPEGSTLETAVGADEFPKELWDYALTATNGKDAAGRRGVAEEVIDAYIDASTAELNEMKTEAFFAAFEIIDLLFLGGAAYIAFTMGNSPLGEDDDDEEAAA